MGRCQTNARGICGQPGQCDDEMVKRPIRLKPPSRHQQQRQRTLQYTVLLLRQPRLYD